MEIISNTYLSLLTCTVWNVIAEKICEYCKKGDMVSLKARIQNNNYVDKDDKKVYTYEFIADQVIYMISAKNKEIENIEDEEN